MNRFDMEFVDKMRAAMLVLSQEAADQLRAWRNAEHKESTKSLEERFRDLMLKVIPFSPLSLSLSLSLSLVPLVLDSFAS